MKLKEIPNNTVVHTPTEDEAKELLAILHENGYEWCGGSSLIEDSEWEAYQEWTCYYISSYVEIENIHEYNEDKTNLLTLAEFKERYVLNEDNFAKSEEEQPQPKFRVGDKVKIVNVRNPMMLNEIGIIEEHPAKNSRLYKVKWAEDSSTFIEDVFLEPYTEPETKPTEDMGTKELNLCKLLAGHEGETFFLTTFGNVIIHSVSERSVQFKTHETAKDPHWLPSSGKLNKNGLIIAFPSRTLYKQYPLDPYAAWMKWREEQTIFHIRIEFQPYEERGKMKCGNMGTLHFDDLKLRTPADRDKCIEEIKAIIEKYSK